MGKLPEKQIAIDAINRIVEVSGWVEGESWEWDGEDVEAVAIAAIRATEKTLTADLAAAVRNVEVAHRQQQEAAENALSYRKERDQATARCEALQQELARVTGERDDGAAAVRELVRDLRNLPCSCGDTGRCLRCRGDAVFHGYRMGRLAAKPPEAGGGELTDAVRDGNRAASDAVGFVDPAPAERCIPCGGTGYLAGDGVTAPRCKTCNGTGTAPGKAGT